MKKCELCNSVARMHCDADQAILCWDCDSKVHAANFLVAKHSRTLLCHACQSPTPWTGSGPKLAFTVSVCQACVRSSNATDNDDDDDDDDDNDNESDDNDDDDDENESDSDDDTSYDDEDDDGDNQVVPMTFTPLPPPEFSSSSSSEESSDRLHSDQEDKSKSTIGFLSKPPPWD